MRIAVVFLLAVEASAQTDLAKALERPVSPGSIALLVEHASEERARERLASALEAGTPEVRAAAARVAHASGSRELVPRLLAALERESHGAAASEMIRGLVGLGDADVDEVILSATRRLVLASVTALALGSRAMQHLDVLREIDPKLNLASVLRSATRGRPELLSPVLAAAIRDGDRGIWNGYLELARAKVVSADPAFVASSLTSEALRPETLWHLLLRDVEEQAAFSEALRERVDEADPEEAFLLDLLARKRGEAPKESPAWLARRAAGEETILSRVSGAEEVLLLLREDERRALSIQYWKNAKHLDEWHAREVERARKWPVDLPPVPEAPAPEGQAAFETVSGFPQGFVSDLLRVTDCNPKSLSALAGANVLYAPSGRLGRVVLTRDRIRPRGCADVSRMLILNHLHTLERPPDPSLWTMLLVPLERDFLDCLGDRRALASSKAGSLHVGGKIRPPEKVQDVAPVYPDSAMAERVEGLVILEATIKPSGCVEALRTLRNPDNRLAVSAILAVSRWRYEPTFLDGVPVPIVMTVTVNYELN